MTRLSNWEPTIKDDKCPHGFSVYEGRCSRCQQDYDMHEESAKVADAIHLRLNGGSQRILGDEMGTRIHPYILNEAAGAMALAILHRTYDALCNVKTIFAVNHPEHDGRISCGAVIGALATLGHQLDTDPLRERTFWLERAS